MSATQTANLTGVKRNTINRYYTLFRERIVSIQEKESPLAGEIEMDESYFRARRVRGKRGKGASGKTIVSGLLKRNDKVYTQIIPNAKKATLQAIIRGKIDIQSEIHTDG